MMRAVKLLVLPVVLLCLLAGCATPMVIAPKDEGSSSTAGSPGQFNNAGVPEQFRGAIEKGGAVCEEVTPSILAAQVEAESNWNPNASSGVAHGLTQFTEETWQTWGKDENGDGKADPSAPDGVDAVMAQAHFMCQLVDQSKKATESGQADCPELIDCALAGYNAGFGAVTENHGIPPFQETQNYVPKIKNLARTKYASGATGGSGGTSVDVNGPKVEIPDKAGVKGEITAPNDAVAQVIARGLEQLGVTYAWGGGDVNGPTKGIPDGGTADSFGDFNKVGFDCSGLMQYMWGPSKNLPRYSETQVTSGKQVPFDQAKAGDMIGWPGHVAMFLGEVNGEQKMLEAPQSGDVVKVSPIRPGHYANVARVWEEGEKAA